MKKALKFLVTAAIGGMAVYKLIDMYKKGELQELFKKFKKIEEPLKSGLYTTEELRIIAQDLTGKIAETEERVTDTAHGKNQKKYDKMNWSQKILSRMNSNLN